MLSRKQLSQLRSVACEGPNKVRQAMELGGVTQVQLADALDFTQPHVSEIVNGNYKRLPTETTRAFAAFFGCQIEDLFPAKEAVAS